MKTLNELKEIATTLSRTLIGKTITNATEICKSQGLTIRIIAEDGIGYYGTADFRVDRINVEIIDGIVVGANAG